jgi:hypothetical protein
MLSWHYDLVSGHCWRLSCMGICLKTLFHAGKIALSQKRFAASEILFSKGTARPRRLADLGRYLPANVPKHGFRPRQS